MKSKQIKCIPKNAENLTVIDSVRFSVCLALLPSDRGRIDFAFLTKLHFENSPNKKTLKQAWRFFLLNYLFVTSTGQSSNFLKEDIETIIAKSFNIRNTKEVTEFNDILHF